MDLRDVTFSAREHEQKGFGVGPKLLLRAFSVLAAFMGLAVLYLSIHGSASFPGPGSLSSVTGHAQQIQWDRYSVNFRISKVARNFSYAKKGGEAQAVLKALSLPGNQPVTVSFNAKDPSKGIDTDVFYEVYEISSPGHLVRSYAQIKEGWLFAYKFAYLLVPGLALVCVYLWRVSSRTI